MNRTSRAPFKVKRAVLAPAAPPTRVQFLWAAISLLALTLYGALLPFNFVARPISEAIDSLRQITLFPSGQLEARGDWAISLVQFAILSFLFMASICVGRKSLIGYRAALIVTLGCIVLTIGIEFLQVFFPPRTVSVNDILVESIGGAVGVLVWLVGGQRIAAWIRRLGNVHSLAELATRLLPAYVVLVLTVQLMPFDFVLGDQELRLKYDEGRVLLVPFQGPWTVDYGLKVLLNMACFFPMGVLQAFATYRRSTTTILFPWAGLTFPLIVEFGQFFVYSRSTDSTDVITGAAAVVLGWRAAIAFGSMISRRMKLPANYRRDSIGKAVVCLLLVVAWAAIVLYFNWRPFDFTSDPTRFANDSEEFWVYGMRRMTIAPFVDYYWGSKYVALDQFIRKSLSFFPFGVLIALGTRSVFPRHGIAKVLLYSLFIGVIIEVGRYFLPMRIPSVSDVLIGAAGAAFGFWLTQFIRSIIWAESALFGWTEMSGHGPPLQS